MKIGFVGAGGTGKTTLADRLGQAINLPFYPSINRRIFSQFATTQLQHSALSAIDRWAIQSASFNAKIGQEVGIYAGIFERTLLDHYMYCLIYCAEVIPPNELIAMQQAVADNLADYSLLLYFPIYDWPVPEDGWRDASPGNRQLQDLILQGYLYSHANVRNRVIHMPDVPVEMRIEFVRQQLLRLYGINPHDLQINLDSTAEFTWGFAQDFLLNVAGRYFIWSSPDYDGDNTIRPFNGDVANFAGANFMGRDKGSHTIRQYCGDAVKFVNCY